VKKFYLDSWDDFGSGEDDLERLSLRQIANLEGVDQQTILDFVRKRKFPKPDGGGTNPWGEFFTYRRFQAERSRPLRASAASPRGYAALLRAWQKYWRVDTDNDPFAGGVASKSTAKFMMSLRDRDE
jgi:hypothetical protein